MRSILIFVLLALMICAGPVSAFGDTVQRYDVDFEEVWDFDSYTDSRGTMTVTEENRPVGYPSSTALRILSSSTSSSSTSTVGTAYGSIKSLELIDSSYFKFTVHDAVVSSTFFGTNQFYVYYYNETGTLLSTIDLLSSIPSSVGSSDLYEFVRSGGSILTYKNGNYLFSDTLLTDEDVYIKIYAYSYCMWTSSSTASVSVYLDDFSTSSILGMNQDWTQASTNIDTSYGIQTMESFPLADYSVQTSRLATGSIINTTQLGTGASGDPAGFVRWNRNNIFGANFGLYQSRLLRDGDVLTSTKFSIFDTTVSGSVSWIDDSYPTGANGAVNYNLGSPDFSSYYYYLNVINSGGTGFSQNLISATGVESVDLSGYPMGDCYAVLSRTSKSTGDSTDIAYGVMSVTAEGPTPVPYISIPYSEYERGDTVDVIYSHEESGYIVIHDAGSSGNYYVSNAFVGSGSNMTYSFEIDTVDPFGFYYVVLKNSAGEVIDNTGYSLVQSTSPYNNSISVDAAEYYYDGIVNVTYSHSQSGSIKVQHVQSNKVYHVSNSFDGDGGNETWLFNIAGTDPLGLYNVLLLSDEGWVKGTASYTVTPAAMSSTWLNVIEDNVELHEDANIAYKAVNSSVLTITGPNGSVVYSQTVQSDVIKYLAYTTIDGVGTQDVDAYGVGTYSVELIGDTTETDSFLVYLIEVPIVEIDTGDSPEDVMGEDETMTEYFDEKFRDFAPSAWAIFQLSIILWFMSIVVSFGRKKR